MLVTSTLCVQLLGIMYFSGLILLLNKWPIQHISESQPCSFKKEENEFSLSQDNVY